MSKHNQKHLTLSNRTYIEQELLQKSTFSSIGEVLHKDPSTISKEVKRYSKLLLPNTVTNAVSVRITKTVI